MIIFRQNTSSEPQYPVVGVCIYITVSSATFKKEQKRHHEPWNIIELETFITTSKQAPDPKVTEMNGRIK